MTYYMILLVIISNNIPLNLLIALTYYLVLDNLLISYINLSSYCSFDFYSPTSCLLELNLFSFKSPYRVLQLTKAYRAKSA